jgi:hypothetical protein
MTASTGPPPLSRTFPDDRTDHGAASLMSPLMATVSGESSPLTACQCPFLQAAAAGRKFCFVAMMDGPVRDLMRRSSIVMRHAFCLHD